MIRVLTLIFMALTFSLGSVVPFEDIDSKKTIVQIGTYTKEKTVTRIQKALEKKQSIYIRKEKKFTVVYVVNIEKKKRKKVLREIRKRYKDAFIQPKAFKVIQKNSQKLQPKEIPPAKVKATTVVKKSKISKKNIKTVAIQIGTYKKEKTLKKTQKELEGKWDIYTKKTKGYSVIYVVNIAKTQKRKVLQQLRKRYKDAFVARKVYKKDKKQPKQRRVIEVKTKKLLEKLFREGYGEFKQKNYANSYKLFKQIFQVDMKNRDVNFYLARSAYEIEKYEEALDIYNYLLFTDPRNKQIKLEIGKTYNKLKRYDLAKKYFVESYK